jgi:UDP-N-acetylglucosamine 2-epimerase (non-hydrolysing)
MKSILIILGTRPEAIKLAPLIHELRRHDDCTTHVCVTGQHREMLDQVLHTFDITPDSDLHLMQSHQTLAGLSARALIALDEILHRIKPDWIVVQGDTTTAMIGALTAFYHRVRIMHVEAGLRTHNKFHPYPEDVNRRIIDIVADMYAVPTSEAAQNLTREGVHESQIVITGNTGIDALLMIAERKPLPHMFREYDYLLQKKIILVTSHRRENVGEPMEQIFLALRDIADRHHTTHHIIFPVHLNPAVRAIADRVIGQSPGIMLCHPLGYEDMVGTLQLCDFVITDSGGIQEEAPSLGKPVIITRETTERPELLHAGAGFLAGSKRETIVALAERLITDVAFFSQAAQVRHLYGTGTASKHIATLLLQ